MSFDFTPQSIISKEDIAEVQHLKTSSPHVRISLAVQWANDLVDGDFVELTQEIAAYAHQQGYETMFDEIAEEDQIYDFTGPQSNADGFLIGVRNLMEGCLLSEDADGGDGDDHKGAKGISNFEYSFDTTDPYQNTEEIDRGVALMVQNMNRVSIQAT